MEKAIDEIITLQRKFFADGATRATAFRLDALTKLRKAVRERTDALSEALHEDLNKSAGESYLTEIGLVMQELECHIRHLKRWSRSRRVSTPLTLWPSRSRIRPEPLGVALIVAPWNYPVQLLLCPLVGAISAGNCVFASGSSCRGGAARSDRRNVRAGIRGFRRRRRRRARRIVEAAL